MVSHLGACESAARITGAFYVSATASGRIRSVRNVGAAASNVRVYACAGFASNRALAPVSTISPARITATRPATCPTTARSCEIKSIASPYSRCSAPSVEAIPRWPVPWRFCPILTRPPGPALRPHPRSGSRRARLPLRRTAPPDREWREAPPFAHPGARRPRDGSPRPDRNPSRSAREEKRFGAEEGTRTPTPLRVHGPEPCASANSATSARDNCSGGFR